MDVNEHEELFNITLRHKLKKRNSALIGVLHLTVTVRSSIMSILIPYNEPYYYFIYIRGHCLWLHLLLPTASIVEVPLSR
jgi:hypothetical protein